MKRWMSFMLPIVGLALFAWIVRGIGVGQILEILSRIQPKRLVVFPLLIFYVLFVRGLRWRYLMRMAGIEYPLWKSSMVWAIGFAAGSVTPGKVGDALRAFYLTRDTGRSFGQCLVTVFVDRLLDLVTVLVAGVVTMLIFSVSYIHLPSLWILVIAVVGVFSVLYLALRRDLVRKLIGPMFRAIAPQRYQEEARDHFHRFYDMLSVYGREWPRTLMAFVLGLASWAGVVSAACAVVWLLGIEVSFGYIALIMPALTLVELLPITISGLGTRDAAVIYFFSVVGIAGAQAVGFALGYLVLGTYLTALVGFVAWLLKPAPRKVEVAR